MPNNKKHKGKKQQHKKKPSSEAVDKNSEDIQQSPAEPINGFAEIMCEYRQSIRDDDFKTNFLFNLADMLNYNEIIIALSHAYLYPSNVLISDVDNAEDNKSVLAIDFSSEQGRKFKKILTDVNVKNKNYQEFIQKVTAIKIGMNINDIKISLSDMFKIIQIKINSILDNSAKIAQDDFDFISTIIQYHYKNFYDLDQLFFHSYFTTLYYIISNINKFPDDHFKVLLVTEFLNILLHASKQNDKVKDIDKHIVLQIMHLLIVSKFFNPGLLQKLDSSTMKKTEDLLKNNIFLRFLIHYDKMCNQGLVEQSNKIQNNLISLSTKSYQMSKGCLAKQNDSIIDLQTHNLYKTYHLVYQGIISSLSNPKLNNKIKTAIFKDILDLDIEHSGDNESLKIEIDKLLEKSNKYTDNLNKLIVNVSSLATNLEISKKNKPDTNDKINLLIQELAILHQFVAKYVEQYESLTLLYSEFTADLERFQYNIETLDKNFIKKYTDALHEQYEELNIIIKSIKGKKLSINDLSNNLSPHLDSEIYSDQVKKITELSNIFSNEDMQNSLEAVDIVTCFMRNIIKTNDFIQKNKTIILCDNIKSEFEKLNDKIKKNIIYQKVYGVELPQQNTKELIQQDKVELKALFEKLHKQLDTDIPQYQINKIETLTENLLSEDIVGKEPVIDELLDFLISFLEKNIKDIKSYQSKPYIQKFQENISSFGNFDCPEIEKMLRCYEAFLIPEKSENIKQKNVQQDTSSNKKKPKGKGKKQSVLERKKEQQDALPEEQLVIKEITTPETVEEDPLLLDDSSDFTVVEKKKGKAPKPEALAKEQPVKSDATKHKNVLASKQDKETKGQTVVTKKKSKANKQRKLAPPETLAKDQPVVEPIKTSVVEDPQVKKVTFLDQVLVHEYNSNTNKPEVKNQPIAESIKKPEVENQSVVESIKKPEVKNQPVVEPIKKPEVENQKVGEITATPAVGDKIVAEIIATPAIGGRLFLKQITNSEIALTQVNRTIIYNLNYDLHLIELNDFVNKEYFGSIIENKFLKELSKNFTLKQMGLLLNALYLFNNDNLEKAYYALDCSNSACKEKGSYQSLDKITISKKTGIEKQLQQYLIQRKNIPTKYGVPEKIVLAPEIYGLILSKMSNSDVTIEELSDIIKFHPANLFNLGRLCTTSYILMLEKSLDILDKENSEQASTLRFIALNELLNIGNYLSKKIEKQTINNVKKTSEKIDEDFLLQLKILLVFQKYITEDIYQLMDQDTLDKTINESQIKLLHLMSDVNQKEINSNNQDVETPMHVESSNNIIKSTIAQYKKAYDDYFTSQNNQITEGKEHNFNMIYKFILDNMIQTSFNPHLNYSFNNILITYIGNLILYDKEEHRTKVPLADNVSKKFFFTSSLYMSQLKGKIDKYFEEKKYNINLKGDKYKDYIPQRNIDKLIIEKENFLKMLQKYYSITLKLEYCYNYIKILAVKRNYYSNNLHKNGNENFVKEFNSFYKIRDALYKQNEKIEKLAYEVKQNQDYNREDIHKLEEINNIVLYSDIEHCFHIFHTHNLAFLSHRSAFLFDGKNRQDQVYSDHAYQKNEIFKSQKALVNNQVQELLDTASVELEKTISTPALNVNAPTFVPDQTWMPTPTNPKLWMLELPTEEEIKLMLDPDEEEINTKQTDNISSNIEINKTNTYSGINTTQEPTEDKINTKQTDNTSSNIDTNKTNTYSGINTTQEPTNHDMNITKTSTKQTNGYNGSTIKSRYS